MVPSVKVLALKVCFGVAEEVNKLLRFLRCFPHVETLHVMVRRRRMSSGEKDDTVAISVPCSGRRSSDRVRGVAREQVSGFKKKRDAGERGACAVQWDEFYGGDPVHARPGADAGYRQVCQ